MTDQAKLEHGAMAEFVLREEVHNPPYHLRQYAAWRWLWGLFGDADNPPWPWRYEITRVVFDTSTWPKENMWCEDCLDFITMEVMRRDGDIWSYCPICRNMRVD